jgi:DNA-binding NarL/FixJ family response regulator
MTRVLVVASSPVVRAGLEAILSRDPGLLVVGGSGAFRTLTEDVAEHEPDVVLLELSGSHVEELSTALSLLTIDADDGARAAPAVVLLSDERDEARGIDAIHHGVRALLSREASPDEILAAVGAVATGLVTLAPEWLTALSPPRGAAIRAPSDGAATRVAPSARELEVLRMIAEGLPNKQIAARLGISEHTVKFHVASVFAKLHASTRAEAVMSGARRGWIVV